MTIRFSGCMRDVTRSNLTAFMVAAMFDLICYGFYRAWLNPSGLLESDDLFYFELAKTSIDAGYSAAVHLLDLNRAIVSIIQIIFEAFDWNDPFLIVLPGIILYWFSVYKIFGNRKSISVFALAVLMMYPDIIYVRYHIFKDVILISLVALSIHYYEQRRLPSMLLAALMCAAFRFYIFPLILVCIFLLNIRKFSFWHLTVGGVLVFVFLSQIDIFSIVRTMLERDTFASGGDYTVKRVAESLGISSPFLLMPLVTLSFFLQPSPSSLIDSGFDQIIPYSFFSTYFLLLPALIYVARYRHFLKLVEFRSSKFVFLFIFLYVLTFALDPILADMRHRVIIVLPLLIIFFRIRWIRSDLRFGYVSLPNTVFIKKLAKHHAGSGEVAHVR